MMRVQRKRFFRRVTRIRDQALSARLNAFNALWRNPG
jgi:hypothetical protein